MRLWFALALGEAGNLRADAGQKQIPPDFWMWKTTPAPPMVPGPNPQLVWVEQTAPPLPTTAPPLEACYGCDCLFADSGDLITGGSLSNQYTCIGGKSTANMPKIKWAGVPKNSGVGHPILQASGTQCIKSQSFAVVVEDLDYPYGVGQKGNRVFTHYWAVNIPGDATALDDSLVAASINGEKVVTVGMNDAGTIGWDPPCPEYGVHRIRTTLWALSNVAGSETDPLDPKQGWPAVRAILEPMELARTSFYTSVKAPPWSPALHTLAQKGTPEEAPPPPQAKPPTEASPRQTL
jgi:phosphatidylethanolamine-binding protein (PEBP) family uncharacterized protein